MFNLAIGTASSEAGRSFLITDRGQAGHAVYGPYEFRDPGTYSVEFGLGLAETRSRGTDPVCAVLDVVRDNGSDVVVSRKIRLSELREGRTGFRLNFTLGERSKLEYRVWTSGLVALTVDEHRRIVRLDQLEDRGSPVKPFEDFPPAAATTPAYFNSNHARFRQYYDMGFAVAFIDDATVLSHDGISFFVRTEDDFNFIGEVFAANVYNFITDDPTCVVDIGLNIGYSSLKFARKENVREVFSFEPFPETFARAMDNLQLNPGLATKIRPSCVGLSNKDWCGDIFVGASDNSGSQTVVANVGDRPITITLADAGRTLGPILHSAKAQGRRTVVKVDCEGSEFAIFDSLSQAGLFGSIDAIMVEWHAMFDKLNQQDLIRPLRQAGFLVFDQSPPTGNGFFYGVRLGGR